MTKKETRKRKTNGYDVNECVFIYIEKHDRVFNSARESVPIVYTPLRVNRGKENI